LSATLTFALVGISRFGLLLGLSVWVGTAFATLTLVPVLYSKLERPQADEVAGALFRRVDQVLMGALAVLLIALAARAILDRAAPPRELFLAIVAMTASRLIGALAVAPAQRAFRARLRDANAPASDGERSAFERLGRATVILLVLEVGLGLYGLFGVAST
jgi:hypothetical protein